MAEEVTVVAVVVTVATTGTVLTIWTTPRVTVGAGRGIVRTVVRKTLRARGRFVGQDGQDELKDESTDVNGDT